ncbi:MAG TPA: cupin-like domain-containing protein [Thermoanaerobaculia bacterium]|nr:cupin-like domain-containing protein [Thermoanaerobaculia bacterium]
MQFIPYATQVPRYRNITAAQVEEHLAGGLGNYGTPFIVTDAMDEWPCMRWTFDSLKERWGDREVVTYGVLGRFTRMRGLFRDYVDYMTDPRDARNRVPDRFVQVGGEPAEPSLQYLNAWNLDSMRDLTDEFPQPYFVRERNLLDRLPADVERLLFDKHTWVFLGPAQSLSRLHNDHDFVHTYIAQVLGRKHFILYSPAEAELLGETDRHGITLTGKTADPLDPDLAQFPRFHEAHPWECTIEHGDMLFLPGGWLHWALGIEAGVTVSRDCVDHLNFGRWFRSMAVDRLPKLMMRIVDHEAVAGPQTPVWTERLRANRDDYARFHTEYCREDDF